MTTKRTTIETLKRTIASALNKKDHGLAVVNDQVGSGVTKQTLAIGESLVYERLLIVKGEKKDSVSPTVLLRGEPLEDEKLTDEEENEVRDSLRSQEWSKGWEPSRVAPEVAAMDEFMESKDVTLADLIDMAEELGVTVTINGRAKGATAKSKAVA